jgi:membrane-bound metal-dependent hydrolase YbcI (DUF457 family)
MLGHSHALSGAVTGAATGIFLHMSEPRTVALAGFSAGMALLPDLDKCGSSPARCLGFLSEAVAKVIAKVSGGHRHATHSILGIAVFTALAWVACHFRGEIAGKAGLALLMTLTVSGALEALPVLVGCATHIAGDMLTDSGCMLGYPVSKFRWHLLPEPLAFTTGTRPELLFVDPLLTVVLAALAIWVADPAFVAAHWHALAR